MQAPRLAQLATQSYFIAFLITIRVLLYSIPEQHPLIQIPASDSKPSFTNAQVRMFSKLFDKALLWSQTVTIYN